jgi:hypothetical protein
MNLLDFFAIPKGVNDQSIAYLGAMFGGLATLPGDPGILAALFKMFNMIVLVVGLFVIVYTVIVGLLTTAHEGEFLAKKFHGLWTPLRMVIGIMALIPTPAGYSGLQVILMWVFIQGVGAADNLWNTTLVYVQENGFYGKVKDTPATLQGNVDSHMKQLFQGLTCLASVNLSMNLLAEATTNSWWDPLQNKGFQGYAGKLKDQGSRQSLTVYPPYLEKRCTGDTCTLTLKDSQSKVNCGVLTYANPKSSSASDDTKKINKAQQDVLIGAENADKDKIELAGTSDPKSVIEQLYYLASFFAWADQQYLNFYSVSPNYPDNEPDEKGKTVYMGSSTGNNEGWGWVEEYCLDKSIIPCCRTGVEGSRCNKETPQLNNTLLYLPTLTGQGQDPNPTSANPAVVEDIYFPYNIRPNALLSSAFSKMTIGGKRLSEFKPEDLGAKAFYDAVIQNIGKTYLTAVQAAFPDPKPTDTDLKKAYELGWLSAGAFYYYISTMSGTGVMNANPTISFNQENTAGTYRNNIVAAGNLFTTRGADSKTEQYASVASAINNTSLKLFMTNVTGGNLTLDEKGYQQVNTGVDVNPLVRIQSYGQQLLLTVEVMYPIVLGVDFTLTALAMASSFTIMGFGFPQGLSPFVTALHTYVSPMFLGLFAVLASIGGLLAVYLPLVPYIIFTMTALSWFISIMEAMVAAPLIAIGILSPSAQHHEILGKADQALMTVFGIFLKPTLMIFGLIVAMLLASVAVSLVNVTFEQIVQSIINKQKYAGGGDAKYMGILELIFFMSAYLFLIVAVLNKCFTVIAVLPGKVMSYIGGQAESGDMEALGEVKGAIGGAAGKAGGAAAQGTQTAGARKAGQKTQAEVEKKEGYESSSAGTWTTRQTGEKKSEATTEDNEGDKSSGSLSSTKPDGE